MLRRAFTFSGFVIALVLFITVIFSNQPCCGQEHTEEIPYNKLKFNFYDVEFASPLQGWICGKAGVLYHTKNGGITWKKQETRTLNSLFELTFVTINTGWVVGQGGLILATTDGGETWVQQKSHIENHLFSLDFVDKNHGCVVGDWGKILITEDGGKNWIDVSFDQDIILYDIDLISTTEGYMTSEFGIIYHTTDGGRTWERVFEELDEIGYGTTNFTIAFDQSGKGIAAGVEGTILTSSDGKNWERKPQLSVKSVYNILLSNGKGLAVGDSATIFETEDSGASWKQIRVPDVLTTCWLRGVSRIGNDKYIISGQHGLILFIKDSEIFWPGKK